jgi:hypothetical protein
MLCESECATYGGCKTVIKLQELSGIPTSGILFMCIENGVPVPPALSPSSPIIQVPPIAKLLESSTVPKLSVILTPTAKKTTNITEEIIDEDTTEEVCIYAAIISSSLLIKIAVCCKNVFVSTATTRRASTSAAV